MLSGDRVDQLHDRDRLADARAAEDARLATFGHRRDQVDDLETRLEDLDARRLILELRSRCVDRTTRRVCWNRISQIDRTTEHVEDASQRRRPDRHADRRAGGVSGHAALQAVGRIHRDRAHAAVAQVHLHFQDQILVAFARHADRVVDVRQFGAGKLDIDDRAEHLRNTSLNFSHCVVLPSRWCSSCQSRKSRRDVCCVMRDAGRYASQPA